MRRLLAALGSTDHEAVARKYLVAGLAFLFLGGALAMIIRWQWAYPGAPVPLVGGLLYPASGGAVTAATYPGLFSAHGLVMIFFAVTPILIGGFGNFLVPRLIGARGMAFPRLNAAGFWVFAAAQALALVAIGWPGGGPAAGWTQYPPLSTSTSTPGAGQSLMLIALALAGAASVIGAVNVVTTVIADRAPGTRWTGLPLSVWGLFLTAVLNVVHLPLLVVALLLLFLDREVGTQFFTAHGEPLLYQHLFWLFGHPEVYILILPVWGIVGDVLARFAGRPPHWYRGTVLAFVSIAGMAGLVYGHHMFRAGLGPAWGGAFEALTLLISAPGTLVFVNWMLTLWRGEIRLAVPMLFALGTLLVFALGGLSGLFLGAITTDILLHDTMWVVGHFHLIMAAATLMGSFAAIYLWFPKMFGRALSRRLGVIHFAGTLAGSIATFGGQLVVGLAGQPRRLYDPGRWQSFAHLADWNRWTSYAAFALGAFQLVFLWNLVASLRRPVRADDDPWQLGTHEGRDAAAPARGERGWVAEVGVAVALGSWAILFAALALTYVAARARTAGWPPLDLPAPPLVAGAVAAALLVASSIALGGRGGGRARRGVAALLGLAAVAVAASAIGASWRAGGSPLDGPVASAYFTIAIAHAVHAAIGVAALAALALGRPRSSLWVWYWHVVVVAGLASFALLHLGGGG